MTFALSKTDLKQLREIQIVLYGYIFTWIPAQTCFSEVSLQVAFLRDT